VMTDVPPRSEMAGAPAQPARTFFKEIATIRRWVRDGGLPAGKIKPGAKSGQDPD
jgi:hypothetical protein